MTTRIHNPGDPRLLPYCGIRDSELLRRHGLFVAEGRLVVQRVLESRRFRVASIMLSDAALLALEPVVSVHAPETDLYVCDGAVFRQVAGFNVHRGCLALVERPPAADWRALLPPGGRASLVIILEGVTNADNVGSVFRNAAALGADAVLLSPTSCDPLYRKAVRTSMGATLRVPFASLAPWPDALERLAGAGYTLAALTPHLEAQAPAPFSAAPRPRRLALLLGSEGPGLTRTALSRASVRLRIPTTTAVDSLNLGVACGIALAFLADVTHSKD
jgi:tRNA G18 (ribose-2'-O)-methylase SpoU